MFKNKKQRSILKTFFCHILCIALIFFSHRAEGRIVNYNLDEQVKDDPERVLPRTDLYSFAVDGHVFFRKSDGFPGLYHSGYWTDFFAELRPIPTLTMNLQTAVYNPGASYGIVSQTHVMPFFGTTWHENLSHDKCKISGRARRY